MREYYCSLSVKDLVSLNNFTFARQDINIEYEILNTKEIQKCYIDELPTELYDFQILTLDIKNKDCIKVILVPPKVCH